MNDADYAKAEHEARIARDAQEYARRIAQRDARRHCEQSIREFNRWIELPLTLATFA